MRRCICWFGSSSGWEPWVLFLKWGPFKDTSEVITVGDYVIRMPYAYLFQYIPGMSRMFAPYRLSAMMVVASVALVALSLDGLRNLQRRVIASLFLVLLVLQPFYRFDLEDNGYLERHRVGVYRFSLLAFNYRIGMSELDPEGWEGIIELPLISNKIFFAPINPFIIEKFIDHGQRFPPSRHGSGVLAVTLPENDYAGCKRGSS